MELTTNQYERGYERDLDIVEISGRNLLTYVNSFPQFAEAFSGILTDNNIRDINPIEWYKLKGFLNALYEISNYASDTLFFEMGRNIPKYVGDVMIERTFPSALKRIEEAYQLQFRNGNPGFNKVVFYDEAAKKAIIECHTAFPPEFERGLFHWFLNHYKPNDSTEVKVELDVSRGILKTKDKSCFFNISW